MTKNELSHIETLENAVKWDYFKQALNWSTEKIAYEMYLNERRLREWVNKRATIITELIKANPGAVKTIRKRLEKEVPISEEKPEKRLNLDIRKVVKKHKEGNSLTQLAKIFKCDGDDFRRWWSDNLSIINQEFRKER